MELLKQNYAGLMVFKLSLLSAGVSTASLAKTNFKNAKALLQKWVFKFKFQYSYYRIQYSFLVDSICALILTVFCLEHYT